MDSNAAHVGIEPGDGLIGRFGDTVVFIPGGAAGSDIAEELLRLIAEVASDPAVPGRMIAARLAGWVIGRMPEDVIAFGVVAPVPGHGVVIFLHGAVWAEVTGPGPARQLSGEHALTWVDQMIPASFARLAVGGTGDRPVRTHPRSGLRAGVVPGQGFVMTPAGAGPAVPGAAPDEDTAAALTPDPIPAATAPAPRGDTAAVPSPEIAPATVMPDGGQPPRPAALAEPAPASAALPTGLPTALPAGQPLASAPAATAAPRAPAGPTGPVNPRRPAGPTMVAPIPLGALVSDSGPTIPLDRCYALGREPHNDPLVRSGAASPIVLQDPDHIVSRVHAHISVDRDTVTVRDASSTQGTFIARPGADAWTQIGPDPSVLRPGWSIRIGKLVFTYQTGGPTDER